MGFKYLLAIVIMWLSAMAMLTLASLRHQPIPLDSPHVDLNYTRYVGIRLANGVNQFLGMRYAAAPVGDLRWRAPEKPPETDMLEPALKFRPICLGIGAAYPSPGQDEDCLYVNVWAPDNVTAEAKLPVWVFIQGGGYVTLSNANWNGAEVVEKSGHNIVMVNFNYRVGLWGFLASDRVRKNGDLNIGLLDQRRLLIWLKEYIAQFGGDPDHVVIHGASAGAGSVAMHLTAYGGRDDGLFVGAISESLFFPAQPYLSELEWQFDRVAQQVGCETTTAGPSDDTDNTHQMDCFRSMDTAALQAANVASAFPGRTAPPTPLFYWTPCVDGDMIEDLPYVLFESGRFVRVPIMFGTDTDEGSVFAVDAETSTEMTVFFQDNYPKLTTTDTAAILSHYPQVLPALPRHRPWFPTTSLAYGEATFICPTLNILGVMSANNRSNKTNTTAEAIFIYRYNVHDDLNLAQGLGVPHLFEAPAIFGPGSIPFVSPSYWTYNSPIVPVVQAYWISFVRELDPNPWRSGPPWESGFSHESEAETETSATGGYGPGARVPRRLVLETGNMRMEDVPSAEVLRCAFWEALGRKTEQKSRGLRWEGSGI